MKEDVQAVAEVYGLEVSEEYKNSEELTLRTFIFYDVNYGELDGLDKLMEAGIPFNSHWEDGCTYTAGTTYCRFTQDGFIQELSVYDNNQNPDLNKLMELLNDNEALVKYIKDFHRNTIPLSWSTQLENRKVYLTKKLIDAH